MTWEKIQNNLNWTGDHDIEINKIKNFIGDINTCDINKLKKVSIYLINKSIFRNVKSDILSIFRGKILARIKKTDLNSSVGCIPSIEKFGNKKADDRHKKSRSKSKTREELYGPIYPENF